MIEGVFRGWVHTSLDCPLLFHVCLFFDDLQFSLHWVGIYLVHLTSSMVTTKSCLSIRINRRGGIFLSLWVVVLLCDVVSSIHERTLAISLISLLILLNIVLLHLFGIVFSHDNTGLWWLIVERSTDFQLTIFNAVTSIVSVPRVFIHLSLWELKPIRLHCNYVLSVWIALCQQLLLVLIDQLISVFLASFARHRGLYSSLIYQSLRVFIFLRPPRVICILLNLWSDINVVDSLIVRRCIYFSTTAWVLLELFELLHLFLCWVWEHIKDRFNLLGDFSIIWCRLYVVCRIRAWFNLGDRWWTRLALAFSNSHSIDEFSPSLSIRCLIPGRWFWVGYPAIMAMNIELGPIRQASTLKFLSEKSIAVSGNKLNWLPWVCISQTVDSIHDNCLVLWNSQRNVSPILDHFLLMLLPVIHRKRWLRLL